MDSEAVKAAILRRDDFRHDAGSMLREFIASPPKARVNGVANREYKRLLHLITKSRREIEAEYGFQFSVELIGRRRVYFRRKP